MKPGKESLSWGERLEEWQKLRGRGERSFFMGLGCDGTENQSDKYGSVLNILTFVSSAFSLSD